VNPVFFIAPVSIAVISAVLALLISVTDMVVNNYGDIEIDINTGSKKLTVKGGANLLVTLASEQIFLPSACGGRGSCGECKCKVLSDVGPVLPTEVPYLTKEQIDSNVRLACQVKLKKNIEIEIPEALFNVKQFTGTVERIKDLTYDIKEVYIGLDDPSEISFKAGQYCQIIVPAYGKIKAGEQRAYSMSSTPSDRKHLEFLIRLVPQGIATTYVHTVLKEGDRIEVVGPFGEFMIRDTDTDMLFVAGGSGMAPFKAILNDLYEKGMSHRQIWYFFGARTKKDLFYLEEMAELESRWDNFHFVSALSEPLPEDEWTGETGLITEVLDRYLKDKIPNTKPKEGYLCGSPGMINACIKVMNENGVTDDRIYFDKFS
jgi:Na+-transporting NADH:ubiquinone oxidoreductase subunit F